jgi:hypothetical protein
MKIIYLVCLSIINHYLDFANNRLIFYVSQRHLAIGEIREPSAARRASTSSRGSDLLNTDPGIRLTALD